MKTFLAVVAGIIVAFTIMIAGCIVCVGAGTQHALDTSAGAVDVVSIDSKVTESNSVWQKCAWVLVLENKGTSATAVDARIEWLDADGFVIDDDNVYGVALQAGTRDTVTGYQLINLPGALNIKKVSAKIK